MAGLYKLVKEGSCKKKNHSDISSRERKMPPTEVIPFNTWFVVEEEDDDEDDFVMRGDDEDDFVMRGDDDYEDDVFVLEEEGDAMELSDQFIIALFEGSALEDDDDEMLTIFVEEPGGSYGYKLVPKFIDLTDDDDDEM